MADPAWQVTNSGGTSAWAFVYTGPQTTVGGLPSLLASVCTALNQLQLPAATYRSWFRAAPTLSTITIINPGDLMWAAVPPGQKVFAPV